MRLVLVGPPGAGKGTQAKFLAAELSIPKISTGDIFRANVSSGTELGRQARSYMAAGDLVPDEITLRMVHDRLMQDDAAKGFLLDGFPRNVPQAHALEDMLLEMGVRLDVVLQMEVDENEVVRRLSGRWTCRNCGEASHVNPPTVPTVCHLCGGELFQREDDREETIRHRLEIYAQETAPLVDFYRSRAILVGLDATGPVATVTERALRALRKRVA